MNVLYYYAWSYTNYSSYVAWLCVTTVPVQCSQANPVMATAITTTVATTERWGRTLIPPPWLERVKDSRVQLSGGWMDTTKRPQHWIIDNTQVIEVYTRNYTIVNSFLSKLRIVVNWLVTAAKFTGEVPELQGTVIMALLLPYHTLTCLCHSYYFFISIIHWWRE